MSDPAAEPATKLQKGNFSDVSAAPSSQAAMSGVTPDQPEANGESEKISAREASVPPLLNVMNTPQMEGGKKRKVALHISYIGAGYHVSFHSLQRWHSVKRQPIQRQMIHSHSCRMLLHFDCLPTL